VKRSDGEEERYRYSTNLFTDTPIHRYTVSHNKAIYMLNKKTLNKA